MAVPNFIPNSHRSKGSSGLTFSHRNYEHSQHLDITADGVLEAVQEGEDAHSPISATQNSSAGQCDSFADWAIRSRPQHSLRQLKKHVSFISSQALIGAGFRLSETLDRGT
ncbi:uncharacterized protein LOC100182664 [Anopheles sinensis]|uniref:Uncharacterized protein LOC100182664 n=1 Tax=Anopheles sinensis TaxID=74873 RepID=A0A084W8X2_ANOSI|nr:uncharacterized protein LOC100182664 [Anopheles sinensis]